MYILVSTSSQATIMTKVATLTIQKWGNSLAVRIPTAVARSAHFTEGQMVEVRAEEIGVTVKPVGERRLTLAEKLALFDPAKHSGEVMQTKRLGAEEM
jgi:antitoxin MazE